MSSDTPLPLFISDFRNRKDGSVLFGFVQAIFPPENRAVLQDEHNLIMVVRGFPEGVLAQWSQSFNLTSMYRITGLDCVTVTGMVCSAKTTDTTVISSVKVTLHRKRIYKTMTANDMPVTAQRTDFVSIFFPSILDVRSTSSGHTSGGSFLTLRPSPALTVCLFASALLPVTDIKACAGQGVIVTNMVCAEFPANSGKYSLKTTPSSFVVWGDYIPRELRHLLTSAQLPTSVDCPTDADAFEMVASVQSPSPSVKTPTFRTPPATQSSTRSTTPSYAKAFTPPKTLALPLAPAVHTYEISLAPSEDTKDFAETSLPSTASPAQQALQQLMFDDFHAPEIFCRVCNGERFEVCPKCDMDLCFSHSKGTCNTGHKFVPTASCFVCDGPSVSQCTDCEKHLCSAHLTKVCPGHTRVYDKCSWALCVAQSKITCASCGCRYCHGHGTQGNCDEGHALPAPIVQTAPIVESFTAATTDCAPVKTAAKPRAPVTKPVSSTRVTTVETTEANKTTEPTRKKRGPEPYNIAAIKGTVVHAMIDGTKRQVTVVGGGPSRVSVTYDEAGMTQRRFIPHSDVLLA